MLKEIKIGILAIVIIFTMIWGYKFLKGKNVFDNSNSYSIIYTYVDQLTASSPVMVHGFKVGSVTKIFLNPDNVDEVIVQIEVAGEIKMPRDAVAVLFSVGLVGGKGIILEFDKHCKEDCIPSGGYINGEVRGLLSSMIPENDIDLYLEKLQSGLGGVLDSMGLSGDNSTDNSSQHIKTMLASLASITTKLDAIISKTDQNIERTISDIKSFSNTLKQNEDHMNNLLSNLDTFSEQLANAQIDRTVKKVDVAVDGLAVSLEDLKKIINSANNSFGNIDNVITKIENGEGSLGKLISKETVYNDLTMTIEHLNLLLQDFRLNPKRYINLSVIGGKNKSYEKIEDDPAFSK